MCVWIVALSRRCDPWIGRALPMADCNDSDIGITLGTDQRVYYTYILNVYRLRQLGDVWDQWVIGDHYSNYP